MFIASLPVGPLQANCYLVGADDTDQVAVIDPGQDAMAALTQVLDEYGKRPSAVLVTHGHFDHMWCAADVAEAYDVPVWIHPDDRHLLSDPMAAISNESAALLRQQLEAIDLPDFHEPPDVRDATDGTVIETAGVAFEVDHVPGHTPGTLMYRVAYDDAENPDVTQVAFTGDFLFAGSIGRTDLAGGSHPQMMESLRTKVLPLDDGVVVLPGHGPQSSVGRERATNQFLQGVDGL